MAFVDPTKPVFGTPTTASVRDNFAAIANSVGFADFQDTSTTATSISLSSGVWTKLTNNALGVNTKTFTLPTDVTNIWNAVTGAFDFSSIPLYSMLTIRADYKVTTSGANQSLRQRLRAAIGDPVEFSFEKTQTLFKTAAQYQVVTDYNFYIGSDAVKNNPAQIELNTDASATVIVNGWYVKIEKMLRNAVP